MTKAEDARTRSAALAEMLRQRADQNMTLRRLIAQLPTPEFQLDELMISLMAWNHIVSSQIPEHLVFAHPSILHDHPETSLYYRGISLLPQKRAAKIASGGAQMGKRGVETTPDDRQHV